MVLGILVAEGNDDVAHPVIASSHERAFHYWAFSEVSLDALSCRTPTILDKPRDKLANDLPLEIPSAVLDARELDLPQVILLPLQPGDARVGLTVSVYPLGNRADVLRVIQQLNALTLSDLFISK